MGSFFEYKNTIKNKSKSFVTKSILDVMDNMPAMEPGIIYLSKSINIPSLTPNPEGVKNAKKPIKEENINELIININRLTGIL